MSLTEQLQADMKTAMREGDAHRRDTLRMAIAAVRWRITGVWLSSPAIGWRAPSSEPRAS